MKKFFGFIFVLVAAVSFGTSASAVGAITTVEQTILDELTTGVTVNGATFATSATDLAQAENYLKANDVTSAQATSVVTSIQGARTILAKQTVAATSLEDLYSKLSPADKTALQNHILSAASALNLKVTFANGTVTFTDAAGNVVYKQASVTGANPIIKATGASYMISGLVMVALLALAVGAFAKTRKFNQQIVA